MNLKLFKDGKDFVDAYNQSYEILKNESDEKLNGLVERLQPKIKKLHNLFRGSAYTGYVSVGLGLLSNIIPETREYTKEIFWGLAVPLGILTTSTFFYSYTGKRFLEKVEVAVAKDLLHRRSLMRAVHLNQSNNSIH